MREAFRAKQSEIWHRLFVVVVLFGLAYSGAALSLGHWPNLLDVLVAVFGACTATWLIDPALQYLVETDDEEENDGDVA